MKEQFLNAYKENADAIFRFVYLRMHDRDEALDITQEAYIRTWRYLVEGKKIDHLRAFLYRTAKNLMIDRSKQKKTRNTGSLDAYLDAGGDVADSTSRSAFEVLDGERAMSLLRKLEPSEYREAVYLRFVDELRPSEIAKIVGVSENVVSVRINRGLKKLRTLFPI